MAVFLIFFLLLLVLVLIRHHLESRHYPPGPPRYPFIGSLLSTRGDVGSRLLINSTSQAAKYGKLVGYFMGRVRCVDA